MFSTADGQKILANQKRIMELLEEIRRRPGTGSTMDDLEEEILDVLPSRCKTLEEFKGLDRRISSTQTSTLAEKRQLKKRREMLVRI